MFRESIVLNANLFLRAMLTDQTIEEMEQQVLNICIVLKIIAISKHGHKQQYHQLHDAHNMSTSTSQRAEECGRQLLVSITWSGLQTQFLFEVTSQVRLGPSFK